MDKWGVTMAKKVKISIYCENKMLQSRYIKVPNDTTDDEIDASIEAFLKEKGIKGKVYNRPVKPTFLGRIHRRLVLGYKKIRGV